jgi:hypothetical protein
MMLLAQVALGVALVTPVMLGLAVIGCWLVFRKQGNRRVRAVGAVLVLLALGLAAQMVRASLYWQDVWAGLDIEPKVSEQEIIGEWRTDDATVTFFRDHTFTLRAKGESRGKWALNVTEFFGARHSSSGGMMVGPERWQGVKKRGQLRLIRNAPVDWDEWNGDLGFRRAANAP